MTKLIMTLGLPGSGKSTWASEVAAKSNGKTIRITKDMLRLMLNGSPEGLGKKERNVLMARDALVVNFLTSGIDVIVDDTNFNPVHERKLRELAEQQKAEFSIKDFTDVSLEECLRRDANRATSVGSDVIRKMWFTYIYKPRHHEANPNLPEAIIVDIDGTMAIKGERSPYDWKSVHLDAPNTGVIRIIQSLAKTGIEVFFFSGRDEVCQAATKAWLAKEVGIAGHLYMRTQNDMRKDSIVKRELFEQHILGKYNIVAVFDDRDQVVDLWRNQLGLTCLQVEYGPF